VDEKYNTNTPISSAVLILVPPIFEKECYGQLNLPSWVLNGSSGMVEGLDFGRITDLGTQVY
jgi:hypothetical protein